MTEDRRARPADEPPAFGPGRQLRLVGAPAAARPRWSERPAPLSYGVDYSFLHSRGRRSPVRWPAGGPITVRFAGADLLPADLDLAPFIDEVAGLTGLDLQLGESLPSSWQPSKPVAGQILLCLDPANRPIWPAGPDGPGMHCVGKAIRADQHGDYISGWVVVGGRPDLADRPLDWQLRHGLGHAVGLGHAHRASELMYPDDLGKVDLGPGDRAGLRLIGHRRPNPEL